MMDRVERGFDSSVQAMVAWMEFFFAPVLADLHRVGLKNRVV
jgi:hypothetical protein